MTGPKKTYQSNTGKTSGGTVDGRNPAPVDMVVYLVIYKVLYMPGGAGFLPSSGGKENDLPNQVSRTH